MGNNEGQWLTMRYNYERSYNWLERSPFRPSNSLTIFFYWFCLFAVCYLSRNLCLFFSIFQIHAVETATHHFFMHEFHLKRQRPSISRCLRHVDWISDLRFHNTDCFTFPTKTLTKFSRREIRTISSNSSANMLAAMFVAIACFPRKECA